jgi:hypothetical protein
MKRLSVGLHGTLGSCRRDALWEGGAAVVAFLLAPRAYAFVRAFFSSFMVDSTTFLVIDFLF